METFSQVDEGSDLNCSLRQQNDSSEVYKDSRHEKSSRQNLSSRSKENNL